MRLAFVESACVTLPLLSMQPDVCYRSHSRQLAGQLVMKVGPVLAHPSLDTLCIRIRLVQRLICKLKAAGPAWCGDPASA